MIRKYEYAPQEVRDAIDYLNSIHIPICTKNRDGRKNSEEDEGTVIEKLQEEYGEENIEEGPKRHWWDVKVFGHPVNIKSSKFGSADNFSSKESVLYSLTDMSEEEIMKIRSWSNFQEAIKTRSKDNGRDYYCFALNKVTNEVVLQGLKTLTKLTPNGNNLLFQIEWNKNTQIVPRTHEEAYNFLVGAYKKSVMKKVNVHEGYETL